MATILIVQWYNVKNVIVRVKNTGNKGKAIKNPVLYPGNLFVVLLFD